MASTHRYVQHRISRYLEDGDEIDLLDQGPSGSWVDLTEAEYLRQGDAPFEWAGVNTVDIRLCAIGQLVTLTNFDPVSSIYLPAALAVRVHDETNDEVVAAASGNFGNQPPGSPFFIDGVLAFSAVIPGYALTQTAGPAAWRVQATAANGDFKIWAYTVQITKWG